MSVADDRTAGFVENCRRIVEGHDRERYLAALFAPPDAQTAWFVLLAANHEIAKTAEVVSEPALGAMRLRWWRESLEGIEAGYPRQHEVVTPLAALLAEGRLVSLAPLTALVEAREADLSGIATADLDGYMAYAEATGGPVHALLAEASEADPDIGRRSGRLWAAVGMLRAAPHLIRAGRNPFPESLLEKAGISFQKIYDNGSVSGLGSALAPLLHLCRSECRDLAMQPALRRREARALRLLTARVGDILASLDRVGGDPFELARTDRSHGLVWRHARRMLRYRLGL